MTSVEGVAAKVTAKVVIALFKKWQAAHKLTKDIDAVFNRAFDSCPDAVLSACHADRDFREMLFGLAESKSADAGKLLDWASEVAAGAYDRQQVRQQLFDFSNQLLDQCSALKRKEAGRVPAVCADFKEQMNFMHLGSSGGQTEPTDAKPSPPLFYVPHEHNDLLHDYAGYVNEIAEILAKNKQATVDQAKASVVGHGGIGKTAMAIEYAYRFRKAYEGGVFWFQADQGLSQALGNIGKKFGWVGDEDKDEQIIIKKVMDRLSSLGPVLMVVDNLEDPAVLKELVLPQAHVLVTTRRKNVGGKRVSLELPGEQDAMRIFLGYANKTWEELSEEERGAATSIVERVGLLPVALEIMGKNACNASMIDLARDLTQIIGEQAYLEAKGETATIAAALAVTSHKYSHPRAKDALLHLSYLFPEELDQEILAKVMEIEPAEAQKMLSSLAEFSVVQPKPGGGYAMHRLVQEAARLDDEGQKVGERVVDALDDIIIAISEAGNYQAGYALIPHLMHVAELSAPESGLDALPNIYTLNRLAEFLWQSGRHQTSDGILEKVQARIATVKGKAHPDYATLLNNRATQLRAQGKYTEAEKLCRQAMEIDEKTIGKQHPNYAKQLNNLAGVLRVQGKYPEAEELYRQAMEIDEKTIGKEHPSYAISLSNLAVVLKAQGKYAEAETLYRQALEIDEKTIGKEHPEYAKHLNNLAGVLRAQGKYSKAETLYRQALEIDERTIGKGHPGYAIDLNNLAGVLEEQGKYPEAEELYRQALDIDEKTIGKGHPDYAIDLNNLAGVLRAQGKYPEAEKLYRQAMDIDEKTIGKEHPEYAKRLNNLAGVLEDQGKYPEAEKLYRQAMEIDEKTIGKEHPDYATRLNNLAGRCGRRAGWMRPRNCCARRWTSSSGPWDRSTRTPWAPKRT